MLFVYRYIALGIHEGLVNLTTCAVRWPILWCCDTSSTRSIRFTLVVVFRRRYQIDIYLILYVRSGSALPNGKPLEAVIRVPSLCVCVFFTDCRTEDSTYKFDSGSCTLQTLSMCLCILGFKMFVKGTLTVRTGPGGRERSHFVRLKLRARSLGETFEITDGSADL